LYIWYRDNCFCGRCGHRTVHDGKLRMLSCPDCGNMIFPKICPAIIVGVINGDHILLTKYSGRAYKNYALIAGFTEIGETAEDTVRREVFEEAGVHVKNIRYWGTQPWGIDSDLLLGYFADLDGSSEIAMDREELSVAGWFHRDEMDIPADDVSLTNDMIRAFIENRHPR
ncbi:MAG: NAD(+) diphosphatase, partial [Clostridia bacterium]|nr:NAD(+) diphosphatase [Clostridia bacterium]